ncbi:MAG TPA: polyprenol monophosphomannose synthase [Solirubrobacteraceae bacterium]|nr:polyprenol monophosphomannose synthase [Solirubrobacteraceae bacterium]
MHARVWLVMPTYNESENIGRIIPAVHQALDAVAPGDHRILVVDDNSPDGTGRLADALAKELDCVEVLHRDAKGGLGKAYTAGFRHALAAGAELILEMDADFSHDPVHLPALITAADDADLVIGSRYVPGGGTRNWGIVRRLISRGGGLYARIVLGCAVQDLTGGFKCIHRRVLESIDLDAVRADGYGFQIEVTYRAIQNGFRVVEVPIIFTDRRAGTSKMSWRIAAEAFWLVPRMRRTRSVQLTRP